MKIMVMNRIEIFKRKRKIILINLAKDNGSRTNG